MRQDGMRDLTMQMHKKDSAIIPLQLRQAVVTAVTDDTLTVTLDGTSITGVRKLASYSPTVNDTVWLFQNGGDLLAIDRTGASGYAAATHGHADKVDLTRWLHRRTPWKGTGGGAIKFNGSTLSGTQRYIWIPSGAGGGSHFNLWDGVSDSNPWSITGITSWSIVYATLTDAEWSSAGRVNLDPSRFTVQGYSAYTPAENHLVLGIRNGDAQDGRFYLVDGRVLDYWRTPTFVNGWTNYAGYSPAGYYKDANGFVHLRGLVSSGTAAVIFTLPLGYRPAYRQLMGTISNSAIGRCDVATNGQVEMQLGNNAWFALDSLTFLAEA